MSTNVLIASTVRGKSSSTQKKEEPNPGNIDIYAPDYKNTFNFTHFVVPRNGSWSCLSFGKDKLSLCKT
jgi:hypothetical protein